MTSWYVLYVRSRAEKKVAERLRSDGLEVFCPLKKEIRQWSDRKKKVEIPYFSSYVFVRMSFEQNKLKVLQTQGVARLLHWLGKPAIIKDEEMEAIRNYFQTFSNKDIISRPISEGEEYQVRSGPFEGSIGVVVGQSATRAILELKGLNIRFSVPKERLSKQY